MPSRILLLTPYIFIYLLLGVSVHFMQLPCGPYQPHYLSDFTIAICPNHDYTLILECRVTDSPSLTWKFPPFFNEESFYFMAGIRVIDRPHVTLILTRALPPSQTYVSQLQVKTAVLRNTSMNYPLKATCQGGINRNRTMAIHFLGKFYIYTCFTFVILSILTHR